MRTNAFFFETQAQAKPTICSCYDKHLSPQEPEILHAEGMPFSEAMGNMQVRDFLTVQPSTGYI
jgi:hypothetical protein